MANEYYERLSEMNPGDLADGLAMEAEFDAISQAFGKLPNPHTGGNGFDGPVRVGDAVNTDEAVNKGQLDNALGTAKLLPIATYGDLNAAAWAALPSGSYLLFGAGSQFSNAPWALTAGKTYSVAVRHVIGDAGVSLYLDEVVLSSTDDTAHVDFGREAWRMGPALAQSSWRAAAFNKGGLIPLEALIPASDNFPVFNAAGGADLVALTAFARTLLDDVDMAMARGTLGLPSVGSVGYRNKLINGGMTIAQRGTSGTVPAGGGVGTFTVDRWSMYSSAAEMTWSQGASLTGLSGASLTFSGNNSPCTVSQKIEAANSAELANQKATFNFVLWSSAPAGVTVSPFIMRANAKDNFSTVTNIENITAFQLKSGLNFYSFTFSTLPPEVINGVQVGLSINGMTPQNNISITDCQLEVGAVGTAFEFRPYGQELMLCQRYYEKGSVAILGNSSTATGDTGYYTTFKVDKRASPTISMMQGYKLNAGDIAAQYPYLTGFRCACTPSVAGASFESNADFAANAEL